MGKTKDTSQKSDTSEEKNRFTELIKNLQGDSGSDSFFVDYGAVLGALDETDVESETVPFPYGGNRDFGKWAID